MMPNILSKIALTMAASALTIIIFKWFGQEFGVEITPEGLAAEAAYPMAVFSAALAGFARFLNSRRYSVEAIHA